MLREVIILFPLACLLVFSCAGSRENIKPMPEGLYWEKCPLCKGTGRVTETKTIPDADDYDLEKETSPVAAAISQACCLLWFLSTLGKPEEHNDENFFKQARKDKQGMLNPDDKFYPMRGADYNLYKSSAVPPRSSSTKKVRCPCCNGTGWVDNSPPRTPLIFDRKARGNSISVPETLFFQNRH